MMLYGGAKDAIVTLPASFMGVGCFMLAFSLNRDRFETSLDNIGNKVRQAPRRARSWASVSLL